MISYIVAAIALACSFIFFTIYSHDKELEQLLAGILSLVLFVVCIISGAVVE